MPRVSRFTAYGMLSTGLAAAVVGSALKTRPNFFAAAVSVGRSSGSLMVSHTLLKYRQVPRELRLIPGPCKLRPLHISSGGCRVQEYLLWRAAPGRV